MRGFFDGADSDVALACFGGGSLTAALLLPRLLDRLPDREGPFGPRNCGATSPDAWGRKLIEKRLGNLAPTEIEYLLNSPDDRAGALGFGLGVQPPAPVRHFNRTLDLCRLIEIADQIVAAEKDPEAPKPAGADAEQAELLLQAGTSMGGARPKATVEDDDGLWLAQFTHPDDRWNKSSTQCSRWQEAAA